MTDPTEPAVPTGAEARVGPVVSSGLRSEVAADMPISPMIDPPPPAGLPSPEPMAGQPSAPVEPPEPRVPTPLLPSWLIAGAAAAVATDLALRRVPWNNVAGAALIAVLAAGLLTSGYLRSRTSKIMILAAVFFGAFLAIRTEPLLTTFNVVAACSLLILAAIHGQGRSFWDFRPLRMLADGGVVLFEGTTGLIEVPAEVAARYRVAKERSAGDGSGTAHAVFRGLMMAVPVVLIFGLLLASADAVFQSFFSGLGALHPGSLIGHLMLMAIGAYTMMVLIRLAATQGSTDPINRAPNLGHIETGVLLVSVNLLFGAFAVAQLMTVLGGADEALARAGLDSKHFARQGFFQLLWVAGLTLAMLMALHVATSENVKARGITKALSLLTVGLTVLIVAVAFTRISFYIDDGGQTPLRLYSAVFSIWVAAAFVITAVRIQGIKATRAWLQPVLILSGLITLAGLNLINPERLIALDNLNRDHDALRWHIVEGQFSGDGQAVLAAEIDRLSPDRAETVTAVLCTDYRGTDYDDGWLSFNLGKWRAETEVTELCG